MIIKEIYNIAELHKFTWKFQGKRFELESWLTDSDSLFLTYYYINGEGKPKNKVLWISEINLHELKMFGLDVILVAKQKLTNFEKGLLEKAFHFNITTPLFIVRNKNNTLCIHSCKPRQKECHWEDPAEGVVVYLMEKILIIQNKEVKYMWSPVCDYITLDPREEKEEGTKTIEQEIQNILLENFTFKIENKNSLTVYKKYSRGYDYITFLDSGYVIRPIKSEVSYIYSENLIRDLRSVWIKNNKNLLQEN